MGGVAKLPEQKVEQRPLALEDLDTLTRGTRLRVLPGHSHHGLVGTFHRKNRSFFCKKKRGTLARVKFTKGDGAEKDQTCTYEIPPEFLERVDRRRLIDRLLHPRIPDKQ